MQSQEKQRNDSEDRERDIFVHNQQDRGDQKCDGHDNGSEKSCPLEDQQQTANKLRRTESDKHGRRESICSEKFRVLLHEHHFGNARGQGQENQDSQRNPNEYSHCSPVYS